MPPASWIAYHNTLSFVIHVRVIVSGLHIAITKYPSAGKELARLIVPRQQNQ